MDNKKVNYPALTDLLSRHPDAFTLLRLRELNIRNLLFYQAELLYLNRQLKDIEDFDAQQNPLPVDRVTCAWYPDMAVSSDQKHPFPTGASGFGGTAQTGFNNPTSIGQSPQQPQLPSTHDRYCNKVREIRETLAKYNEALAHYIRQEQLPSPPERAIRYQHEWLKRTDYGNSFLAGTTADAWEPRAGDKYCQEDFLTFSSSEGITFLLSRLFMAIRTRVSRDPTPGKVFSIDSSSQGEIAQGLSVIISSVIPVLPIIILFFINSLLVRIGLILVFTAVFAAVLVFGLKIPPSQVLAITSA